MEAPPLVVFAMSSPFVQAVGTCLFAAVLYLLFAVRRSALSRTSLPLPPGPDDAWYSPGERAPIKLAELADIYGPVVCFRRGKQILCVINRVQAANEILQKHGAETVDRPRFIAAGEIMAGGMRTLLVGAGDRIRKLRRALLSQMQPSVAAQYQPIQMKNAKTYILDVLTDPDSHVAHARRYAASLVMSMTYGKTEPTYFTDPEVQEMALHGTRFGKVVRIGAHVVDNYPILRYVPFVTATLRKWHREELQLFNSLVDGVRNKMENHTAQPCFVTYLLERQQEFGLTDNELGYLAGSMFGAGSDTSASAISFVAMAAAMFPEEADKVREQLDAVVGRDRLPTFEDMKLLPRVTAFFWETYRWRPVSWGGFAHRAMKDILWNGYVIPKGTAIIGNHWGIRQDPDAYPEPLKFKHERWLNENGNLRDDMSYCNFGFGRRVCVGQHVANNSLYINTALLLWAFNITENPKAPIDTMNFTDTANVRPLPFKAIFEPRMDNLQDIIEAHLG
ncbi:hypothetical protein NM688_g5022 [Phlebia brevispora]|uniref:Uncharacterized protein n=1 Tax=Phlebia brevispora TaxID=194682 RepID=A0ACC1T1I6_9APHY|nr:hypothetical protein NM688_g5022 [Phlebia brevispora]